jgi:DNA-binding transcriptional LysR family regulator
MLHVIVPLVAGFRASYPEVELELNSNEGFIDLIERAPTWRSASAC